MVSAKCLLEVDDLGQVINSTQDYCTTLSKLCSPITQENTSIKDTIEIIPIIQNESINFTNITNQTIDCSLCTVPQEGPALPTGYCNISLELKTDKLNYSNNEKITIYNQLNNNRKRQES